jgi:hypothetical protein
MRRSDNQQNREKDCVVVLGSLLIKIETTIHTHTPIDKGGKATIPSRKSNVTHPRSIHLIVHTMCTGSFADEDDVNSYWVFHRFEFTITTHCNFLILLPLSLFQYFIWSFRPLGLYCNASIYPDQKNAYVFQFVYTRLKCRQMT